MLGRSRRHRRTYQPSARASFFRRVVRSRSGGASVRPQGHRSVCGSYRLVARFRLQVRVYFVSRRSYFGHSDFRSANLLRGAYGFLLRVSRRLPVCEVALQLLLCLSFLRRVVSPLTTVMYFAIGLSQVHKTLRLFRFSKRRGGASYRGFVGVAIATVVLFLFWVGLCVVGKGFFEVMGGVDVSGVCELGVFVLPTPSRLPTSNKFQVLSSPYLREL